jgi:hypothetical protein
LANKWYHWSELAQLAFVGDSDRQITFQFNGAIITIATAPMFTNGAGHSNDKEETFPSTSKY